MSITTVPAARSATLRTSTTRCLTAAALIAAIAATACGAPGVESLRESFATQLAANRFVRDFERNGEDLLFTGPGADGGVAKWRVHIDSATIEPNPDQSKAEAEPYKGTVKSSWYSDGQLVKPGARDSNLPIELMANGLTQDCWALWNEAAKKWGWE